MEKEDGKHGYGTQAVNVGAVFQGHDKRGIGSKSALKSR